MPLPFSFSTQRHDSEAETPLGSADIAEQEKVMNYAPGNIITEPVFGTPGNSFSPPVLEASPRANIAQPRMAPNVVLPPLHESSFREKWGNARACRFFYCGGTAYTHRDAFFCEGGYSNQP